MGWGGWVGGRVAQHGAEAMQAAHRWHAVAALQSGCAPLPAIMPPPHPSAPPACSKENLAKTSRTRSELQRVQSELHATKSHAQSLDEKNIKARVENALLKVGEGAAREDAAIAQSHTLLCAVCCFWCAALWPMSGMRCARPTVQLPPCLPLLLYACACLQEKVTLLERFDFEEAQESECKKQFTRYRLAETY